MAKPTNRESDSGSIGGGRLQWHDKCVAVVMAKGVHTMNLDRCRNTSAAQRPAKGPASVFVDPSAEYRIAT
eukprot:13451725-Alexandrium_andersonii.AAC.1